MDARNAPNYVILRAVSMALEGRGSRSQVRALCEEIERRNREEFRVRTGGATDEELQRMRA